MRYSISNTAEYGTITSHRTEDHHRRYKESYEKVLSDIQDVIIRKRLLTPTYPMQVLGFTSSYEKIKLQASV